MEESHSFNILALDMLQQLKGGVALNHLTPIWNSMSPSDCNELAIALFDEAKEFALQGFDFAFKALEIVNRISPSNSMLQFQLCVCLFDYGVSQSDEKMLHLALEHASQTLELDSRNIDAWYIWGDILVHIGLMKQEAHYFYEADEKYEQASSLAEKDEQYLKKFLWDWALCWYYIGKHSKETIDFKKSIDLFEKYAAFDCQQENFWRDYGNAYAAIALLIKDERFLLKALRYFQKALQLKPTYFKGWLSAANTFQKLYLMSFKEEYLAQAHSAYSKAADLERDAIELWISWGQLFLHSGVTKEDAKHLQMCLAKADKALEIDPNHMQVLSMQSRAYATLACCHSNIEYLKKSMQKIDDALLIKSSDTQLIYCKGYSLYMHGRYFDDSNYYMQAIETFKQVIKEQPHHFDAFFYLGLAELALGNLHHDEEHYISAHNFFRKASELNKNHPDLWNQWGMTHLRLAELLDDVENIKQSVEKFERSLSFYKNSNPPAFLLFNYGCSLDFLGNYTEDPKDYKKGIEILEFLLKNYPGYECVHYNLALVYSHLAETLSEVDDYAKALEHFYHAAMNDPEDELVWLGWGTTLIDYAQLINEPLKQEVFNTLLNDADKKLRQAAALGDQIAYYHLACLYSLKKMPMEALHFLQIAQSKNNLPTSDELLYEPKLEILRSYEPFHKFIQSASVNETLDDY